MQSPPPCRLTLRRLSRFARRLAKESTSESPLRSPVAPCSEARSFPQFSQAQFSPSALRGSTHSGTLCACYEPLKGAALVFLVAVAWIGDGPRVLVNKCLSALPSALGDSHGPRKSALALAKRLLASACPERRPLGVMVSDLKWCRIVAAPLTFHAPAQIDFGDARWARLSELGSSSLAEPAARAMGVVASYVALRSPLRMPPPVLPGGARAAEFVPQAPPILVADAARWGAQIAADAAACDALRVELSSLAETDSDGEWFAGWAGQVDSGKRDEVPPELRGHDADCAPTCTQLGGCGRRELPAAN